jgi:ribosomal protein S18 acetylase RimI-like enzyme
VEVRSLGYRTDLAILALEGSVVTDRGDHRVIRTPGNPDYWWGNFLLLRELKPGSGGGWMARFAAEFPDARHVALGLDEPDARAVDPGEFPGMTMARNAVMTATSVQAPPHPNTEAAFRALEGDTDWRQSLELTAAIYAGEPGSDTGFLAAQLAAKRALAEAGHGVWLGAFLDGTLVSQLGLVTTEPGLARYQSVETHPAARRRGLAGTLVWHAGAAALTGGTRTLVMVAEPEDAAIRVYRSVGFTVTEPQLSFIQGPAQSLPAGTDRSPDKRDKALVRLDVAPVVVAVQASGQRILLDAYAPDDDGQGQQGDNRQANPVAVQDADPDLGQQERRITGVAQQAVRACCDDPLVRADLQGEGEVLAEHMERPSAQRYPCYQDRHADAESDGIVADLG